MKGPVRIAVIGAGLMGLRHCQNIAQHIPGAELAAVADLDGEAARSGAAFAPGALATRDYQKLLSDASIDAIVIASPNITHTAIIEEVAQARKHIFCEKPIGVDLSSTDAALAAVARHGVKLQVGFQRRFDPAYRKARDAIAAGELGAVELVVATTRDPKPATLEQLRRSGGIFLDTAIHDFDSVRFLTGLEAVDVYATGAGLIVPGAAAEGFVDTALTVLRLNNGGLAAISNSLRAVYGYDVSIEVMGAAGKIAIGHERQVALRRYTAAGVSHDHVYWFLDRFAEAYLRELVHFVECVTFDREPEASGADGRAALVLAEAAARSMKEGRPVPVSDLS